MMQIRAIALTALLASGCSLLVDVDRFSVNPELRIENARTDLGASPRIELRLRDDVGTLYSTIILNGLPEGFRNGTEAIVIPDAVPPEANQAHVVLDRAPVNVRGADSEEFPLLLDSLGDTAFNVLIEDGTITIPTSGELTDPTEGLPNFTENDFRFVVTELPHCQQLFEVRVFDEDGRVVGAQRTNRITAGCAEPPLNIGTERVLFFGALEDAGSYNVRFYADTNDNMMYDIPPVDHAWSETYESSGGIDESFTHSNTWVDIGF